MQAASNQFRQGRESGNVKHEKLRNVMGTISRKMPPLDKPASGGG